jgi:putative molybdopterin biosynthesis protein
MKRERARLQAVPLEEARQIFFTKAKEFLQAHEEEIQTTEALGRVASRPIYAQRSLPHYASAAMDGIAVRAERTHSARTAKPLPLRRGLDFEYVDTGDMVPEGFDAVIKIEDVQELEGEIVQITKPVTPGKHVREVGEDFALNSQVVPADFQLTPEAISALLNTGNLKIWVKRRVRATFIPTGSELVPPEQELSPGKFAETNSQIVKGYVEQWGGTVTVHAIVPNEAECIRRVLEESILRYDLILIGAGTSKGRGDLVAEIVRELGEVLVHGVAYHPGHPVLLGVIDKKPVVGLPGYPVATWLALWLFVKPLLERYYYGCERELFTVRAKLAKPIKSVRGYREFVRAKLERAADGSYLVHPLQGGASKLSTIVGADGWVEVPEAVAEVREGELVEVTLLH